MVQTDKTLWPDLFVPKFAIEPETRVATAGSCFAQRIRQALADQNMPILDVEPAPEALQEDLAREFGYGLHSARYGNIYTPRQLLELLQDVQTGTVREELIWQRKGRFFDMLRPNVEPDGCASVREVLELRRLHLARLRGLFETTDVFVFTLGLTEAWLHGPTGRCLPVAPGVIAGEYDPGTYRFHNFSHSELLKDLKAIRATLRQFHKKIKIILTTSPVPITATASGDHVLNASTYTKSTLRSVAGEMAMRFNNVDYFPGYEIVTTWARDGMAYQDNLRSIRPEVVADVMAVFLDAYGLRDTQDSARRDAEDPAPAEDPEYLDGQEDDLVCEESLIEALQK
ncbi:GSCFA domain-containing protein [Celeribacter neptunius]|uniref:GSCFA domain-containing protein n=1 Tax=Celeribacter neptunius TaxID=588602 RepID=UPI0015A591A6|nr:GSCFA domain-containing protein [Celeribacter neptunius]